jgi:hypothetical protein
VNYRNNVFLPAIAMLETKTRKWAAQDEGEELPEPDQCRTVLWLHDESTFYANDRRKTRWVHKSEMAVPYTKGEGHSLMVAEFVSADYGWLRSPDETESTWVLFKAGKGHDGYFDNENILAQTSQAMDILEKHYADEDHVMIFDNTTTHLKRAEGALSATKMPKGPSKNFGVEISIVNDAGKPVYGPDGKILKKKVLMANGKFADGTEQQFYHPDSHELAGQFKGMATLLEERGFQNVKSKKAQCGKKFMDCPEGPATCCCRRIMYNQPDFMNVESLLEITVKARGFKVLFLPKFHCELSFLEQCWRYAKRHYRMFPPSTKEEDLEKNVIEALEAVPLIVMRRWGPSLHLLSRL